MEEAKVLPSGTSENAELPQEPTEPQVQEVDEEPPGPGVCYAGYG